MAIYHFARTADDIADEGDASASQRLADLAAYRLDLAGALSAISTSPRWPQVFEPLQPVMLRNHLPPALLHQLLDAFEQDVRNPPYADRALLLDYCSRSANPIGRLLLHLYGIADALSLQRSDAICSALQLINFWQDLSVDGPRHRHYVPLVDMQRHGLEMQDLVDRQDSLAARQLVSELCDWTEALMQSGAPLALTVPGRAGWELRLVVQGGLRILEKIRLLDHAVLAQRPTLKHRDAPLLLWRALRMGTRKGTGTGMGTRMA